MLNQLRKHGLRPTVRTLWFRTWIIEGRLRRAGRSVRMLFAGFPADRTYFTRQLFSEIVDDYPVGKHWGFEVPSLVTQFGCDLSLTPTLQQRGTDRAEQLLFRLPCWLGGQVELSEEDIRHGRTPSRRRDLRNIRRRGYTYRVTTNADDLGDFYDNMYQPTMSASHGAGALFMSRNHMLERLEEGSCELLQVLDGEKAVAGSLIAYDDPVPRLWSSGILHADVGLKRKGIGTALYLLSFEYLYERGEKLLNIGRSRPFLNDGAMYFKRRFAPKLYDPSDNGYDLCVSRPTETVVDTLAENPFIYCADDSLRVATFARPGRQSLTGLIESIPCECLVPGVSQAVVNVFERDPQVGAIAIPDRYASQITLLRHALYPSTEPGQVLA